MKKFSEQFNHKAKEIGLRRSEREDLRERLLTYMEYHPLPDAQQLSRKRLRGGQKRFQFASAGMWSKVAGVACVFFLVIVPVMAEKALPGDALYPVKVSFNEELRGILTSSPYEKIEWETERLERRVDEAKLLADSGRLTAKAEADMVSAILQHSQSAQSSIDFIRESDRDQATLAEIDLASALDVSVAMVASRDRASGATSSSAISDAVSQARASLNLEDEDLSYEKLVTHIEAETTKAYEYLDGLGEGISSSDRDNIEERLDNIKDKVKKAEKLKEKNLREATLLLVEALGSTNKVVSFVTKLDVRNSVGIDELVPAISAEEKEAVMRQTLEEADLTVGRVKTEIEKLATTSSNYIDLTEGVVEYEKLHASSSDLIEKGELDSARGMVAQTFTLAEELLNHIKALGIEVPEDPVENNSATSSNSVGGETDAEEGDTE